MTQERLAEAAELDLRFLQRVVRGSTNLSVVVLVSLADALDCTPASLLRRSKLAPPVKGRPRSKGAASSEPKGPKRRTGASQAKP